MPDILLNALIFAVTLILLIFDARKDGKWEAGRIRKAFHYFTVQSNALCAAASLTMAVALSLGTVPEWVWILKYIGTAAVTLTMLTVFFFLAPSIGKDWYGILLKGPSNLFMHFLTPVAALVTFCVFEKRGMTFARSLWGMLPVVLYGALYLYKVVAAPEEKRWEDFYGFNKSGKWPISLAGMLAGTFLICMGLMALQNL